MTTMPSVVAERPAVAARVPAQRTLAGRPQPHPVDPRAPRQPAPPARRDLFATYLDHMRRRAGVDAAPHLLAHGEFCTRLRIPENIADALWTRWLRHYLRYGPDWS